MDKVFLNAIRVQARHGVLREEKLHPQPFEIDVSVFGDFRSAGRQDLLGETVDYSQLGEMVVEVAETNSFDLIEALAEAIAERALGMHSVLEVEVTVRKMRPPVSFAVGHSGITIRRTNG